MKLTPRNNIPAFHLSPGKDVDVDTVYEICDAEFNSDKKIHDHFNKLTRDHKTCKGLFKRFLVPLIEKVSYREELYAYNYPAELIADRIVADWNTP